jgi:hypothetical protein
MSPKQLIPIKNPELGGGFGVSCTLDKAWSESNVCYKESEPIKMERGKKMKKFFLISLLLVSLAGCATTSDQSSNYRPGGSLCEPQPAFGNQSCYRGGF